MSYSSNDLTFSDFHRHNSERSREKFPACEDWSPNDWMTALAGEVGELANLLKKLRRGESASPGDLQSEMGDILVYLDLLAERMGFSLADCLCHSFNKVNARVGYDTDLLLDGPAKNVHFKGYR